MILAIDIGNTAVGLGLVKGKKVVADWKVATAQSSAQFRSQLKAQLETIRRRRYPLEKVVLCSVVPRIEKNVVALVRKILGQTPLIVGKQCVVPILNHYRIPSQVGQDRLVVSYAASQIYGVPAIVVDMGTAITVDIISSKGAYEGGIIIPGIRLSAAALFHNTALLPNISIEAPAGLIGKTTKESILSGLFFGYGAMLDGLIDKISSRMRKDPVVVATGGYAYLMRRFSHRIKHINPQLIFQGLALLAKMK